MKKEVHLEPQIETTPVAELEAHRERQNPSQKGRKHKRTKKVGVKHAKESEDNKEYISDEA